MLRCCETSTSGSRGTGVAQGTIAPEAITGFTTAVSVSVGSTHSCAVATAGRVLGWGGLGFGQFGLG